jgi:hypothetical protein
MVWIHADIYEQELVYLQTGQEATVTLSHLPDREFRGRVAYIPPNVDEKTYSGRTTTVFVALDGGKFEPRTVTLGPRAEQDQHQVLNGVSEGERIVISGQFLLDSESPLREALQKMTRPRRADGRAERGTGGGSSTPGPMSAALSVTPGLVKYICPVPEHGSIQYPQAGKCPLCGATLVPMSRAMFKKLQHGGEIIH